ALALANQPRRAAEAIPLADRALAASRDLLGADSAAYAEDLRVRAVALSRAGKAAEATAAWNEVLKAAGRLFGPYSEPAGLAKIELALLAATAGRQAEAWGLTAEAAGMFGLSA